MNKTTIQSTALVAAMFVLAACSGKQNDSAAPATKPAVSDLLSPAVLQKAAAQAKQNSLPKPDYITPDSAYVEITKGNQLMFLYAAFSGLPPDYDKMASAFSSEFRNTSDEFKKHDLMAAIKPKLDAEIANAKAHPYVLLTDDNPGLSHYDFDKKSFQIGTAEFQSGGYFRYYDNGNYVITLTNGEAFQQLPVADEAKAKTIESLVSKYQSIHMKIFAFVQSTDDSGTPTVQATITKIQLLDSHGQVLLEVAGK
ncbi:MULTISPECIES: DUF4852 domain-containing protein [Gammaproteobacteria]|uniref:DUF4852 domain-containing protein n=1 Tax=Gammaproteobacteria TaxID=1236 RepID=UPI000260F6E2|nr:MULTISPECIES: DUF4852 domain-containing protein [Rhodanobacter]EIM04444.1 hypothetical protein UUC_02461 [Rhodanobacter denitrificans]KZC20821.1 hypothetical protein RHOFW104R3_23560 [Rhodanobacter denitrificans]UJJ49908.1 DUF4852 domain-containing protein [Rhodanobacter denitrificans]UJJ57900.1 DUF4852 domain-containing protein [Rhodanobacter denitrificans]UJM91774.1 DUF4852 domain-containing protein [Rhodanobacter denitrificans]